MVVPEEGVIDPGFRDLRRIERRVRLLAFSLLAEP